MRLALLALAVLPLQDRYAKLYAAVTFAPYKAESQEELQVLAVVAQKDHWMGAFRTLEEKVGPFPDTVKVEVDFDLQGDNPSSGGFQEGKGVISFNVGRLVEYQRKADAARKQLDELARQGKKAVFRVPPLRFDRLIYHELTHVLQGKSEAPDWFSEGMACWVGDDMNYMCGFAYLGKAVGGIHETPHDEVYARGHAFWKWLATKGATKKVAEAVIYKKADYRKATETATGMAWDRVVAAEKDWSTKQIDALRPKRP